MQERTTKQRQRKLYKVKDAVVVMLMQGIILGMMQEKRMVLEKYPVTRFPAMNPLLNLPLNLSPSIPRP